MSYIIRLGFELELFSNLENTTGIEVVDGVLVETDAGINQLEIITPPHASIAYGIDLITRQANLMSRSGVDTYFVCHRPDILVGNSRKWQRKPRYVAAILALRQEKPDSWTHVLGMADYSSLQINFSGEFDPFGDAGAFLVSLFNLVSPFIAEEVHKRLGYGIGHLRLWQWFADSRRLPHFNLWFKSGIDMKNKFEKIPRLIGQSGQDYVPLPTGESQRMDCRLDLGLTWWFLRPKLGDYGPYMEARWLPSMEPAVISGYATITVDMVEMALDWFFGDNKGMAVTCRDDIAPLLLKMHRHFRDFIPDSMPIEYAWSNRVHNS